MSYLFDSSSIFKAVKNNTVEFLAGNYTLELTRYELGNILWKEKTLLKRITDEELESLAGLIKKTLALLKILDIECHEMEIVKLAGNLQVSFYDASYIFLSKKMKLQIVTEDEKLIKKIRGWTEVMKLEEITLKHL